MAMYRIICIYLMYMLCICYIQKLFTLLDKYLLIETAWINQSLHTNRWRPEWNPWNIPGRRSVDLEKEKVEIMADRRASVRGKYGDAGINNL